jgi:signal transduction histidine kinase
MGRFLHGLNVVAQCRRWRVPLWSCPQFLFIVMGIIIIFAMVGTNMVARRFAAPEVAAIVVLFVTAFLFVIGYFITKSFEQMAQTSQAKSEFMSIMSHQLRTPLTNILWRLEKMLSQNTLAKDERRDVAIVYREEQELMQMVNAMLEVHRIEEKALVLEKQAFMFRDLVVRVADEFQANAQKKEITLHAPEEREPFPVFGDAIRIRWVIENLLDNALRYSGKGTTITVDLARKGTCVILNVSDQGPGIVEEAQKKLFTKFFRGFDKDKHLTTEGFGLGLYIAKAIIEAHGGGIGVRSQLQKGSTFWFTLPLKV